MDRPTKPSGRHAVRLRWDEIITRLSFRFNFLAIRAAVQALINRYERDPAAREECIRHYGAVCVACGLTLADRYGPEVNGLIHVHHLNPLASVGRTVAIDP